LFGVMPRRPENKSDMDDCKKAAEWLRVALNKIGGGAKTAAGYGRFEAFVPRSPAIDWLDKEIDRLAREQNKDPYNVLIEMPLKVTEIWNSIEDTALKEKLLTDIKTRYGKHSDHPTGGLKKPKKIYDVNASDLNS